jgi:type I restriction enzyme S subunit
MTKDTFFANFGYLADAPNGVQKLREMILQLAVQGKLVPQDPTDEPASKLLERIKAEKARLLKEKKIKNADLLPPIGADEVPYELPHGWVWEKLGNYCLITMGQSPESKFYNTHGEGLPFYQGKAEFGKTCPSPRVWCAQPQKIAEKDDILISVRAPVGPTNICPDRSCIGRGLAAINALNSNHVYLLFCLRAFEKQIAEKGVGSTFVAISRADLAHLPIPVPPIAEQHRIVAKVDQLMALCDELEKRQQ